MGEKSVAKKGEILTTTGNRRTGKTCEVDETEEMRGEVMKKRTKRGE